MKDTLTFAFPAKADYMLSVRLLCSAIGTRSGLDVDELEDLKSAASEACLLLLQDGSYGSLHMGIDITDDLMRFVVTGRDETGLSTETDPSTVIFAKEILCTMVEEVVFAQDAKGKLSSVAFTKHKGTV